MHFLIGGDSNYGMKGSVPLSLILCIKMYKIKYI